MTQLLAFLLRGFTRKLLWFTAIVLVLAAGHWLRDEWVQVQRIIDELPALRQAQASFDRTLPMLKQVALEDMRQISAAGIRQLDARIRSIDIDIEQLQRTRQGGMPDLSGVFVDRDALAEQLAQSALREAQLRLRHQQKAHLVALRARVNALANRQAALDTLDRKRSEHVLVYAALRDKMRQREQLAANAGLSGKLFFTDSYRQLQGLDAQVRALRTRNDAAHRAFLAQHALVNQLLPVAALATFRLDERSLAVAAAPLRERLRQVEQLAGTSGLWQVYRAVLPLLGPALVIMAVCLLVPFTIRLLFYFVLAPLAARRPPIVIDATRPAARMLSAGPSRISAVSERVTLTPGDELLIRPDYCQSQPAGSAVTTKLLFDWQRPVTSLAAQLWMLNRLRTTTAAEVVISSTADPLDEVALLELAAGESFVLQPRGLVGILFKTGQRPVIRSHWRLGSLHAWLTLQLRYLAFEGPATLVVKGCRGVCLEAACDRSISQDASLGFSAHASYATVRAKPFLSYARGAQSLFHDRFAGPGAWFLYEEVPRNTRPGRRRNNPLEGLFDAGMKAFGV